MKNIHSKAASAQVRASKVQLWDESKVCKIPVHVSVERRHQRLANFGVDTDQAHQQLAFSRITYKIQKRKEKKTSNSNRATIFPSHGKSRSYNPSLRLKTEWCKTVEDCASLDRCTAPSSVTVTSTHNHSCTLHRNKSALSSLLTRQTDNIAAGDAANLAQCPTPTSST